MTAQQGHGGNRRGGSPLQKFEWKLRSDTRLNSTTRLAWLLKALSAKRPANMTVQNLAAQLGVSEWVVGKGLRRLVEQKLFMKTSKGYRRTSSKDFARRVRRCKELNLAVRLAWLLIDLLSGAEDGQVAISLSAMADELGSKVDLVSVAAQKLVDLGLFCRGRGAGGRYAYSPVAIGKDFSRDGKTIDQDGNPVDDSSPDFGPHTSYEDYFAEKHGGRNGSRSSVRAQ